MNLLVAALSNTIFLSKKLNDGTMATNRKDMTKEAVEAVATHIHTLQSRGKGFGYNIPTEDGDFFLTLVPADKIDEVKAWTSKNKEGEG